jgi:hypothetical protein
MSGLFGGGVSAPPKPKPPAPMPDEQSPQVIEAKRMEAIGAFNRSGRESTRLSGPTSSRGVGGQPTFDSFNRPKLGG